MRHRLASLGRCGRRSGRARNARCCRNPGIGRLLQWVQPAQAEHVAGVDRVRVAQPGLDFRHAQPAWAQRHGRRGRGRQNRHRRPRRPIEYPAPLRGRVAREASVRTEQRLQPHSQRGATAGALARLRGADRMASGAAQLAMTKSWAARPMRSSGEGRPTAARIGRSSCDSQPESLRCACGCARRAARASHAMRRHLRDTLPRPRDPRRLYLIIILRGLSKQWQKLLKRHCRSHEHEEC